MPQKRNKRFKGSVAIFAIFLMFILAVTTLGIITTAALERRVSISTGNSTTAFQIAESGMERTLQYFKSNFDKKINDLGSCSGGIITYSSNNTIRFKDNAEMPVYITDCNELISRVKIIKSIGTTKQETRAIEEDVFLGATKLLLHLNGENTDGDFEDSSFYYNNHAVSVSGSGNAEAEDESPFANNYSVQFSGGGYLSIPDSSDWDLGTGNFTIDFWARPESLTTLNTYLEMGAWEDSVLIRQDSPSELGVRIMGDSYTYAFAPAIGNWYHIAVVRKDDNLKVFIDGEQVGTDEDIFSTDVQVSDEIRVGSSVYESGQTFNGYMDEVRISKGVARWISDFTPPSAEYWPD